MKTRLTVLLLASHALALGIGFALGVYLLPLLIAPPSPTEAEIGRAASRAMFTGTFRRDLKGSDRLHWGEGMVSVGPDAVSLNGKLSPGPDYKLYLSPEFVETEADFLRLKSRMIRIGDVRTFENFLVKMPTGINPANYTSVVVWCERFSEFITAAKYRQPGIDDDAQQCVGATRERLERARRRRAERFYACGALVRPRAARSTRTLTSLNHRGAVNVRYFIDPETGQPHIYRHEVAESEVEEVLSRPGEDRAGSDGSRVASGRTGAGRLLRVIYVPDPEPKSVFVITA